jgi:hypothetical protein
MVANEFYAFSQGDAGQVCTVLECSINNPGNTVAQSNAGQIIAIIEGVVSYSAACGCNRGQIVAIVEGLAANACNTSGNNNA